MPKPHTLPILYDDARKLTISFLREYDYLKPQQYLSGVITWRVNGEKVASISISVSTYSPNPYAELNYTYNETPVSYRVRLERVPSNLGRGFLWYFACPYTGKRCRKLYLIGGRFYHRQAFSGCMYEKQTHSKGSRLLLKKIGLAFGADELYSQLRKKHFKKIYAGKPTKRYLRLIAGIEQCNKLDYGEMSKMFGH